ncbi:sigma-B regulation protein RsbU (phosphoserine phosphatase) [Algoriphagus ratkowskyi]|uniref:PP2C family protein-serine/threonine phosphatase n=2 Tax=Algoriphagus ratkowskyi TaxID=57028 RepID=A0A2W7R5E4_9BACT|nr:PP2C family protein-serine/threonine phosphatase [Algoriphagus ratkowskyi]PZX56058.1 sigma-B regulation protein RsbU (phosphoserine phosphatase) [Algoriphagus ratkowskyi]TXD77136.1 PP2C family protein-serine/threonine phosphatase [Algoriphagus ratkowskyi]
MITETHKYQRKELQLKSLLEITQAINENQSEAILLNIFKFTCLVHLNIKALILFVAKEGAFENKISHGVKGKIPKLIAASQVVDQQGELSLELEADYSLEQLEYLPVYHKDKMLAILFLRRKDEALELDLDFTKALTNILVVALENKRFARKQLEQEILNREVAIASQVQQMLFPAELPIDKELKAKVTYLPHSMVGGDYYDLIRKSKDEVYFCIADVSGKGIAAALLMSNFQAALRTLLRSDADLEMVVKQLNYTLYENTHGERFITFFLGYFNFKTRELMYVNAGHNPPLLCRDATGEFESLQAGTTILGAFDELPFLEIGKREHLTNFSLHLYTDGLTEAMNPEEEEYGEDRLEAFVTKNMGMDPDDFHRKFLKKIEQFSKNVPLRDDLTLLSLRFQ